jgi:signal transduction histidine kinase
MHPALSAERYPPALPAVPAAVGTIFLVDDEPMVTHSLRAMLSLETPYRVLAFNHPQDALNALAQTSPDVVLADFLMPGMDGITLLKAIRQECPHAALMLLTGYADKQSAVDAINEVGIYRYLEKPWDNAHIKLAIEDALERVALLRALEATRQELHDVRQSQRLREDFVATLTHDLRTPMLAAIQTLGFFANGSVGPLLPKQHALIAMLIDSHHQTLDLVNVLLDVYRYESGQQRLLLAPLCLHGVITGVVRELMPLAQAKQHQLVLLAPAQPLPLEVMADARELRRVLTNLVGNAIEYTPPGGCITTGVLGHSTHWQVFVADNGRGIPKADQAHLFQRFSQGTSRQRNSGTGLGLYLSRQIVEAHGGSIGVESQEDVGSRFWFHLPRPQAHHSTV